MRALVLILVSICVLPFIVRPAIATEIWIFAIFGLGLNLLLGYTGLLSFGQSTFFGSAAYVAGWLLKHYAINVFVALGIGVGVGALSALLVGYLCVQRSGLYFIMLTFALNQLFYFIAYQWTTVTGGEDGMPGIPRPDFLGLNFKDPLVYYVFVSALFLLALGDEANRRVATRQDPAGHSRERGARRGGGLQRAALQASRLRDRRRVLRACRRALRHALRHRAARGHQLRVFRQRGVRDAHRRLRVALRADHRLVCVHLAFRIDERGWVRWPLLLGVAHLSSSWLFFRGGGGGSVVKVLDMAILETESPRQILRRADRRQDVTLSIEAGSLHSIIGPNGAGKTTLFNLLTGTFAPTTGRILYDGQDITGTRAHRIAHLGLARSFQRTNVFPAFSLFDNVWVAAFATARSWQGLIYIGRRRLPRGRRTRTPGAF